MEVLRGEQDDLVADAGIDIDIDIDIDIELKKSLTPAERGTYCFRL